MEQEPKIKGDPRIDSVLEKIAAARRAVLNAITLEQLRAIQSESTENLAARVPIAPPH
jgi:hypothetical protein